MNPRTIIAGLREVEQRSLDLLPIAICEHKDDASRTNDVTEILIARHSGLLVTHEQEITRFGPDRSVHPPDLTPTTPRALLDVRTQLVGNKRLAER